MEIQRPRDWRGVSLVAIMHVEEPRAIWSLYHCHKVHFTQSARTDSLVRIDLSADAQLFHANGHFGARTWRRSFSYTLHEAVFNGAQL